MRQLRMIGGWREVRHGGSSPRKRLMRPEIDAAIDSVHGSPPPGRNHLPDARMSSATKCGPGNYENDCLPERLCCQLRGIQQTASSGHINRQLPPGRYMCLSPGRDISGHFKGVFVTEITRPAYQGSIVDIAMTIVIATANREPTFYACASLNDLARRRHENS